VEVSYVFRAGALVAVAVVVDILGVVVVVVVVVVVKGVVRTVDLDVAGLGV
jgi:hypothetical protein